MVVRLMFPVDCQDIGGRICFKTFSRVYLRFIRYLPLENTKMEAILDKVQKKIHWGVREACSVIGLLFFTIGILFVEGARMLAYTLLRPWLHLMRFIIHLVSNLFCDVCYICSIGCRRTFLPITDACATWSHEVTVPVIKQFRP
ncbi:hypothetical protein X801_07421, partial [Opisthorchis viverrini]